MSLAAERERDRQKEKERQRDRETERQRDRETERQRDRETERQRDRETERQRKTDIDGEREIENATRLQAITVQTPWACQNSLKTSFYNFTDHFKKALESKKSFSFIFEKKSFFNSNVGQGTTHIMKSHVS